MLRVSRLANSHVGVPLFLAGWIFATGLSEGLLRGIRLSVPVLFRVPYHLMLALFFLYPVAMSWLIRDAFALWMQRVGAIAILLTGVFSMVCDPLWLDHPPPGLTAVYLGLAVATAAAYGYLVGNRWYFAVTLGILGSGLAMAGWHVYRHLRQIMAGLDRIAIGAMFFLIAILVSLAKMGVLQKWSVRCRKGE